MQPELGSRENQDFSMPQKETEKNWRKEANVQIWQFGENLKEFIRDQKFSQRHQRFNEMVAEIPDFFKRAGKRNSDAIEQFAFSHPDLKDFCQEGYRDLESLYLRANQLISWLKDAENSELEIDDSYSLFEGHLDAVVFRDKNSQEVFSVAFNPGGIRIILDNVIEDYQLKDINSNTPRLGFECHTDS